MPDADSGADRGRERADDGPRDDHDFAHDHGDHGHDHGDHGDHGGHGHDHGDGWERLESLVFLALFLAGIGVAYGVKVAGTGWVGFQWALVACWVVAYLLVEYLDLSAMLPAGLVRVVSEPEEPS